MSPVDASLDESEFGWNGCNFPMPICSKGSKTSCILQSQLCDGNEDCDDGSDENQVFCHAVIVSKLFNHLIDKVRFNREKNWGY